MGEWGQEIRMETKIDFLIYGKTSHFDPSEKKNQEISERKYF